MFTADEEKYYLKKTNELLQLINKVVLNYQIAETIIDSLRKTIIFHEHKYYVQNQPLIEDIDFDKLEKFLRDIENNFPELKSQDSPTDRVGADISEGFKQVKHRHFMLSLSNTYSVQELYEFDNRLKKILSEYFSYICELKFDGTAISVTYQDGVFVRAVTRGDGVQGDDVSNNVKTIRSIPLKLKGKDYPAEFEIRGEIFMSREGFRKLNEERRENDEAEFANPRNSAAGTLKILDHRIVAKRPLDCYFYYLIADNPPSDSHYHNLLTAKNWGFKISEHIRQCADINEVAEYLNYWDEERKKLPFDTDGVVIKIDSYRQQQMAGFTAKSPRWATAFKFKTERVATRLLSVSYQVGRTGSITPVANLEAVLLGGTTVKRASLHNADQILLLDIHENDIIFVEKGGEIIPKIVGVDYDKRTSGSKAVAFIEYCPECNSVLERKEGEANHYCPNEDSCPPQIKGKILHFIGRKAMNIGFAEATVDLLFEKKLLQTVADIYLLKKEDISILERFGEKSADNIIKSINESKSIAFEQLLYALGIRYAGETVAKTLARHFKNIESIASATREQLIEVEEIGDRIAESVFNWFRNEKNIEILSCLKEAGLQFSINEDEANVSNKLSGKSFVVSGVFSISRDELKRLIEINGGKNLSSVTANTNYLLAGDKMGPAKLETAQKLGVNIIGEDEFFQMLS